MQNITQLSTWKTGQLINEKGNRLRLLRPLTQKGSLNIWLSVNQTSQALYGTKQFIIVAQQVTSKKNTDKLSTMLNDWLSSVEPGMKRQIYQNNQNGEQLVMCSQVPASLVKEPVDNYQMIKSIAA